MKTATFKAIKEELKATATNTKYFNKAFYEAYIRAYKDRKNNIENGIYNTDFQEYNEVKQTRFYIDNSCNYCLFQEIIAKYEIT